MNIVAKTFIFVGLTSAALSWGAKASFEPVPFKIGVHIPVGQVLRLKDFTFREKGWRRISSQARVGKVYTKTFRSGVTADDALIEETKAFFLSHGIQATGAIAYSFSGDPSGFDSAEIAGERFSEIDFSTSDASAVVQAIAHGRGALDLGEQIFASHSVRSRDPGKCERPVLFPQPVLRQMRRFLMASFPGQIDAPARVSLFAYDNHTVVVESYLDRTTGVTISTASAHLRDLTTGKLLREGQPRAWANIIESRIQAGTCSAQFS